MTTYRKNTDRGMRVEVVFENEDVLVYRRVDRPWRVGYDEYRMVAPHNFKRSFRPVDE